MKKLIASAAAATALVLGAAGPASAVDGQAWINGWVSGGSTCDTPFTVNCQMTILTGGSGMWGANRTTVWITENSPVYNCYTYYRVPNGARLGAAGVLDKLIGPYTTVPGTSVKGGAYVTIQYGSADPSYVRC